MATLTSPVAVRVALRGGPPVGLSTWPAGIPPRQSSQAETLGFGQGWGKRRFGGGGTAVRGKAGWCRKQQQCSPDTLGLILRFSANPRDGATWWARAAAARGKLAMVLPRERAAADGGGGGGAQSAAGRENGRWDARAAAARDPAPGRGAENHAAPPSPASLKEEPPPVGSVSFLSWKNQSPSSCHSGWATRVRATGERLSHCKHFTNVLTYQTTPG